MATKTKHQAKIITLEELRTLRYPLPDSWKKAAGMLKRHRKALERHMRDIRKEWDRPRPYVPLKPKRKRQ